MGQQSAQLATAAASLDSSKKELEKSKDDALDKSNLNAVLTIDSLSQLLVAQNFDMPAGYVNDSNGTQYIVQVGDEIKSIEDLTNLVLMDMKLDGIAPIHVGDVADVEMTDNSDETYAIVNGNPGIMLSMGSRPATLQETSQTVFWTSLIRWKRKMTDYTPQCS